VEPGGWDERLERLGLADAYLGRGYLESARILDPGRPVLLELDGAAVFACLVRELPGGGGREDVTTPYGYGGPVAASPEAGAAFWDAYRAWARDRGVVTTFVRFHPLYENHRYAPEAGRERLADTATWPLMPGADLYAGMHAKHRSDCRKSEQAGLEVSVATAPPIDDFAALYEATMRERDAADFYLFPPGYWEALAALGDGLLRVDGRLDGELVASTLCLASPPWLHYHLAAMNDAGRSLGASKVTLLEAARWGQERGYEELHLGSGLGGAEDSLWKFKQRFSDHPGRELWIGKLVHDADAYRELGGTDSTDGFFPAYRASG
jgi:hypothetical protein